MGNSWGAVLQRRWHYRAENKLEWEVMGDLVECWAIAITCRVVHISKEMCGCTSRSAFVQSPNQRFFKPQEGETWGKDTAWGERDRCMAVFWKQQLVIVFFNSDRSPTHLELQQWLWTHGYMEVIEVIYPESTPINLLRNRTKKTLQNLSENHHILKFPSVSKWSSDSCLYIHGHVANRNC